MNEGRKVIVYKWEKAKNVEPRSYMEKVPAGNGTFLEFGVDFEELTDTGVGNYSTAIVEMPDGSVVNVPVEMIVFNN